MKIVLSLLFFSLSFLNFAQEFSPTNKGLIYPERDHATIDSLNEAGNYNEAFLSLVSYLETASVEHNVRSIYYVRQKAIALCNRIRLPESEIQDVFHRFHTIWDHASEYDQTVIGWMLLEMLDHYAIRHSFSYDEESLKWYVGDSYTQLYNGKFNILEQVYTDQILSNFHKLSRIPCSAVGHTKPVELPNLADVLFLFLKNESRLEVDPNKLYLLKERLYEYHNQRQEWAPIRYLLLNTGSYAEVIAENQLDEISKWEKLIQDDNASYLSLRIAQNYYNSSRYYNGRINREVENKALDALKKIEESLSKFPESPVRTSLEELKQEILSQDLQVELVLVPKPENPNLLRFTYRNLDEIFVEVRHITRIKEVDTYDPRTFKGFRYDKEKFKATYQLTDRERHLTHTTDILMNCFPTTGRYLVVIGKSKEEIRDFFKLKPEDPDPKTTYLMVDVTNLGIETGVTNDSLFVHVVNRWKGKNVKKAEVTVKTINGTEILSTNRDGLVKTGISKGASILVRDEEDTIRVNQYGRYLSDRIPNQDAVYMDRPIYRPGQTIQFKFLAMKQVGNLLQVDANAKRVLRISNRNDVELYNQEIEMNAFGSYSFSLATKSSLPSGTYTIYANDQYVGQFRLEEYKRPTFVVSFDPIKGLMANNNPVTISGSVQAYAGYPLASELVKIQVNKWEYKGFRFDNMNTQKSDTVILVYTDNSGRFAFTYTPQFKEGSFGTAIYCEAKVTRNTGETNFANANFYVGNERYQMSIAQVERDDWNIEGYRPIIKGNNESNIDKFVDFYILKRKNVKRYVKEIDKAEFSRFGEKEWKASYPNMLYGDLEREYDTITMGVVQTGEILKLDQFELASGEYKVVFQAIMSTKETLTEESYFVWREKGWNYTLEQLEIYTNKKDPALMDFMNVRINTAWRKVHVLEVLENKTKTKISTYPLKVGHDFTLRLDSSYYFGGQIHASFWKDGYHFETNYSFFPRDTARKLEWRWIHKVNESEPGATETWSFELRDAAGFYVESEALLNAYDASLDQFAQAYYEIPQPISNFNPSSWRGHDDWNSFSINRFSAEIIEFADGVDGVGIGNGSGTYYAKVQKNIGDSNPSESAQTRKNFNETALFIPQYATKAGENSFQMKLPDNLTTYHFNGFAHTKDGRFVHEQTDFVVKKKLMLEMNQPRFIRSKDELNWEINFRNLSDKDLKIKPAIQFFSVETGEEITSLFKFPPVQEKLIKAGKSESWLLPFEVPTLMEGQVKMRVEGRTIDFSDILETNITVLPSLEQQTYAKSWVVYPKTNNKFSFELGDKIPSEARIDEVVLGYQADEHVLYLDRLVQNFYRTNDLTESYFYQYAALSVAQHLKQTVFSLENLAQTRLNGLEQEGSELGTEELWPETKTNQEKLYQGYALLLNAEALENARQQAYQNLVSRQEENGLWSWIGKGHGNVWLTTRIVDEYIQLGDLGVLFDSDPFVAAVKAMDSIKQEQFNQLENKAFFAVNEQSLSWYQARTALAFDENPASTYFGGLLDTNWRKLPSELWSKVANIYILREENMSAEVIFKAIEKLKVRDTTLGAYWVVQNNFQAGNKEDVNLRNQILGWKLRFYAVPPDSVRLFMLKNISGTADLYPNVDLLMATFYLSLKQNSSISGDVSAFGSENMKVDQLANEILLKDIDRSKLEQGLKASNYGENFILLQAQVQYTAEGGSIVKSNEEFRIEKQYYLVYNGEEIPMRKGITLHEGSLIRVKLKIITPSALSYLEVEDPRMSGAEPKDLNSGYQYGKIRYWMTPRDLKTVFYIESLTAGTSEVSYDMVLTNKGVLLAPAAKAKSYYQPSKYANTEGILWNVEP